MIYSFLIYTYLRLSRSANITNEKTSSKTHVQTNPTSKIATPKTKKTDDKSLILYSGFLRHPLVGSFHAVELDELNSMLAFVVLQVLPSTCGHSCNDTRGLPSYRSETPITARLSIRALAVVNGSVLLEQPAVAPYTFLWSWCVEWQWQWHEARWARAGEQYSPMDFSLYIFNSRVEERVIRPCVRFCEITLYGIANQTTPCWQLLLWADICK